MMTGKLPRFADAMQCKAAIESQLAELKRQFGEWTYDIPLQHGNWTKGNVNVLLHTRFERIVQIVNDLCSKPLASCRILDLRCLDGLFSIEVASHGADAPEVLAAISENDWPN
jgi:hypothetical protein